MIKIKLEGLNIYRARGKWYVYHRATGEALIRNFVGERADLERKLASPEFVAIYNRPAPVRGLRTRSPLRRWAASSTGSQMATSTAPRRNAK